MCLTNFTVVGRAVRFPPRAFVPIADFMTTESTYGVRLYTPSGSPGVNGTTDWEEDYNTLHLQVNYLSRLL
jgi:hypothetical protein